jgi:hypothetical protein
MEPGNFQISKKSLSNTTYSLYRKPCINLQGFFMEQFYSYGYI